MSDGPYPWPYLGLRGLIVLAPWVIEIFYSDAFMDAVELMRWCLVGCVCRVISWPLSFVATAKNRPKDYSLGWMFPPSIPYASDSRWLKGFWPEGDSLR